jgi:hypothetical protein
MGCVLLGGKLGSKEHPVEKSGLSVRYRWRYSYENNICIGEAEVTGLLLSCSEFHIEIKVQVK